MNELAAWKPAGSGAPSSSNDSSSSPPALVRSRRISAVAVLMKALQIGMITCIQLDERAKPHANQYDIGKNNKWRHRTGRWCVVLVALHDENVGNIGTHGSRLSIDRRPFRTYKQQTNEKKGHAERGRKGAKRGRTTITDNVRSVRSRSDKSKASVLL